MAEFAPQTNLFKTVNRLSLISKFLFWFILTLSVVPLVFAEFCIRYKLIDLINIFNIIGIGLFFSIEILNELILLPQADSKRRDDFIDNSFGSKFSTKNSIEYYDNDEVSQGLYKASVNLFENCFFTYSLVKITIVSKIVVPILMLFSMTIIAFYGFREVPFALSVLQALFSVNILGLFVKHLILLNRLSTIQDFWINLFQNEDFKNNTFKYQTHVYRYWLQYETLHSKINAGIPDKTFLKYNPSLITDWNNLKIKYNIN